MDWFSSQGEDGVSAIDSADSKKLKNAVCVAVFGEEKAAVGRLVGFLEKAVPEAAAILIVGPDGDLHATGGVGFEAIQSVLVKAGLPVCWGGLCFSDVPHYERHDVAFALSKKFEDEVRAALATGIRNLSLDPRLPESDKPRGSRVCIATNEIFGPTKNGGIGTAYTSLAEALAAAGHDVTILYLGKVTDEHGLAHWREHYRERRIRLEQVEIAEHPTLDWEHDNIRYAHLAFSWLRQANTVCPFDIIHFPECNGHAYFSCLAKRQGLAFQETTLCVGTHSSTEWIFQANNVSLESFFNLSSDFLERGAVAWADAVLGPSLYLLQWMRAHHWELPEEHVFQQQYIQPHSARGDANAPRDLRAVEELVFFGRLETRKGLSIFCDALDHLASIGQVDGLRITFMGKEAMIDGVLAKEFIAGRSEGWPFEWQIIDNLLQDAAVEYLQGEGRVAIMASPVDNSPNTVYEAIGLGVPFLASRTGGIPELIHPGDVATHTFYHRDIAERGRLLAELIDRAVKNGHGPARPAIEQDTNELVTLDWHARLGELHRSERDEDEVNNRAPGTKVTLCVAVATADEAAASKQLLETFQYQTHTNLEIVLATSGKGILCVPDHARVIEVEDSATPAELRDAAAAAAEGEFLLFARPATAMEPHEVETFLRVHRRTEAPILTAYHKPRGSSTDAALNGLLPDYPAGGDPFLNLLKPAAGSGHLFVSRSAYDESGGFAPLKASPLPDQSFLAAAAARGVQIEVVPEPLFRWDGEIEPDSGTSVAYAHDVALTAAFGEKLPFALRRLPHFARAQGHRSAEMIKHMNWLRDEVDAHKAFVEEREEVRRSEKHQLKQEIKRLKAKIEVAKKEKQIAVAEASKPFWKRKK